MPTKKVGLIHSMFRPSDDACMYPFLIPSNYFASTVLRYVAEIANTELNDKALAAEAQNLKGEVDQALAIYASGTINKETILAYEVDGFGNQYFADDANSPSLLSLPYLDSLPAGDPLYASTRKFVLSEANHFFFKGTVADGVGGPHVGMDMVWPMSLAMQALTSTNDAEIVQCIRTLKATHAGTGFMHEAFHKNDPVNFTRPWFAWANSLFGELIYQQYMRKPALLDAV
jgi:meiotically up-regulated gene 157 (Mug157) protein